MARTHWYGERIGGQARTAVARVLRATALRGVDEIVQSMRETPDGGSAGPMRSRSLPGEPPAVQTGALMRSIAVDDSGAERDLVVKVGAQGFAPYAVYLEIGTHKMAARPFLRPWLDKVREPLKRALEGILR